MHLSVCTWAALVKRSRALPLTGYGGALSTLQIRPRRWAFPVYFREMRATIPRLASARFQLVAGGEEVVRAGKVRPLPDVPSRLFDEDFAERFHENPSLDDKKNWGAGQVFHFFFSARLKGNAPTPPKQRNFVGRN